MILNRLALRLIEFLYRGGEMNTITLSKNSDFGDFYDYAQNCDFNSAIKAFNLSKKSSPCPVYALLERACSLITSEVEALKIYKLAVSEGGEYQEIADDAIERYDTLTKNLTEKMLIDFSDRNDLHLRKASKYYNEAPADSKTKVEMLKFMEEMCFYLFDKKCIRMTDFRLKTFSSYLPADKLSKYKLKADELLAQKSQ